MRYAAWSTRAVRKSAASSQVAAGILLGRMLHAWQGEQHALGKPGHGAYLECCCVFGKQEG